MEARSESVVSTGNESIRAVKEVNQISRNGPLAAGS